MKGIILWALLVLLNLTLPMTGASWDDLDEEALLSLPADVYHSTSLPILERPQIQSEQIAVLEEAPLEHPQTELKEAPAEIPTQHLAHTQALEPFQWEEHKWKDPAFDRYVLVEDLSAMPSYNEEEEQQKLANLKVLEDLAEQENHPPIVSDTDEHAAYKLKIGDKLSLQVYGEMDSIRHVTVNYNGDISYLTVRNMPAKGKTLAKLREDLQNALASYYRSPLLVMTPLFFSSENYTVMGEVRNPGIKPFIGNPTVLSGICLGGGFTTRVFLDQTIDQVDLERSFLTRHGKYLPVDFSRLLKEGDITQDIPLEPGDYLYFAPRRLPRVYVVGEVNAPRTVAFIDTITLTEAVAQAGGTLRFASSRVAVIRGALCCPERYLIDYNRIIKGCALDFQLQAGDIVYVPAMQYSSFKEIIKAGIASFVSIVFTTAGTNAFFAINPHAAVTGVISPFPFVNTSAGIVGGTPFSAGVVGGVP